MRKVQAAVHGCLSLHENLYRYWIRQAVKSEFYCEARPLLTAFYLLPVFLFLALICTGHVVTGFDALMAGLCLSGFVLLFCAGLSFDFNRSLLSMSAIALYCAGLVWAALTGSSSPVLVCLMILAMPVESWLMTRNPINSLAGLTMAFISAGLIFWQSSVLLAPVALFTAAIAVIYSLSLLWRVQTIHMQQPAQMTVYQQFTNMEKAFGGLGFRLDMDGMITDISDHSAQMLGVSRDVMIGTLLLDRIHVSDRIHYLQLMADIRHQRNMRCTPYHVRIRNVVKGEDNRQSVEHRYFRIHGMLIEADTGHFIYLTAIENAVEMTQADELVRLQAELQETVASRRYALASLSHELRNPLNAIIGFSDILLHEMSCRFENEKQRDYTSLVQRSGLYALDIVNTILDASKIEAGTYQIMPKDFSIREAVNFSMNILAPQAEHKQVILCDRIQNSIGNMIADQRAVQQILINLMGNAVKFTPMGGCVTLDGFKDNMSGEQMVFTISDNGVGIAEEDIERLGQPFTQVGNSAFYGSEGVGLGLSLVKALVEKHEGQFEISSRLGKGTIVTIRLPVAGPVNNADWQQELKTQAEKDKAESVTVLNINRLQIGKHYVRQEEHSGEKKQSQERKIA